MKESINMHGAVKIITQDCAGRIIYQRHHKNRIVKSGRQLVAELYAGVSGTPPSQVSHMAVGTGGTAATDADTVLEAERVRKPVSTPEYAEIVENGIARIKVTLKTVFDFGEANGDKALQEAGIFTAETEGIMYNRVVFDPVSKTDTFKLTLIWDIVF